MYSRANTKKLALGAMLTALVIILQFLGSFIKFGPFAVALVLVPIVIGAATCGAYMGAWLGLVFGAVVLLSGDAAAFLTVNPFGTVVTVLAKGALCGTFAGLTFNLIKKKSVTLAVFMSAVVCPLVNTGVFFLGCLAFFMDTVSAWAADAGGQSTARYMFLGLAGGNFILELALNIALSPIILRLLRYVQEPLEGRREKRIRNH